MTTTLERDLAMLATVDPVVGGDRPYEPLAVEAVGNAPRANPHPDPAKGWVARMLPVSTRGGATSWMPHHVELASAT